MRVPGTAVAHCMPNYEQRGEDEIGFKFVELEIYIDASARGRFNRPKITSDAVLLSSARSGRTGPTEFCECQTPLPGGVAPNALCGNGYPCGKGYDVCTAACTSRNLASPRSLKTDVSLLRVGT